jgi:penicillin amidase
MNLPQDHPIRLSPPSYEWADRSRIDRIQAVLSADERVSVEDSKALQLDTHSVFAERVTALLEGLDPAEVGLRTAVRRLRSWNHKVTADSWEAAVFEAWTSKHLVPAFLQEAIPAAAHEVLRWNPWIQGSAAIPKPREIVFFSQAFPQLCRSLR